MKAFAGILVDFTGDPRLDPAALRHFEDGLLVVEGGRVVFAGPRRPFAGEIVEHPGCLLVPGFVDAHVHYAQTDVIARPAAHLIDWLERHSFPAEARFSDAAHARAIAEFFLDELARQGTTTAAVLPSVHVESVNAFFEAARARRLRMAAGKVLMDRHSPQALREDAEASHRDSAALIRRWHGVDRLVYAVTPRFAATSSERQLELAGRLLDEAPGILLQTHAAEHPGEVQRVAELFPWARSYLDIYDRFGLLRRGALFAHCIHVPPRDWERLAESGAVAVHCPTSNLFLGSGLFDVARPREAGAALALGTDVGAGSSFSMLRTMQQAYQVAQLCGRTFSGADAFYLATLGGARALCMEKHIGSFEPGREADFVVLRPDATPLLARRMAACKSIEERLFVLMHLADERAVAATYILGERANIL